MFVLWAGLQPSAARAEDAESAVVIVRVPGDETILSRLRAELSSYRFRAMELSDKPGWRSEPLSQLALQRDAQAALRAKPEMMAVELWVRAAGGSAPASEELVNAGPGRDPEVLALRVTEAMRARGLALPPLAAAPSNAVGPAAAGGARGSGPNAPAVPAAKVDVGVAEPRTLQPGELTEPVVKPPEPVKAAAPPAKPAAPATPAKPAEQEPKPAAQTPARAEPKPAATRPETAEKQRAEQKLEDKQRAEQKLEDKQRAEQKLEDKQRAEQKQREQNGKAEPQVPEPNEDAAESSFSGAREALAYVQVGPAAVLSPGPHRLGPALDLLVSVTFRPYPTSSISLVGLIPLLATDLVIGAASVDVRSYGIGGFGDLHLPLGRFELSAGLGGLALISTMLASPDLVSNTKTQRLAALLGRVGASLALTRELHVSASIMTGLTVERLKLQFTRATGEDAAPGATWGSPLLLGSLSIEIALPWDR